MILVNIKKRKEGFTILEIVIAITIFVAFIIIGVTALLRFLQESEKSQAARAYTDQARVLLERMKQDLNSAAVNTGQCPGAMSVGDTYSSPFPQQLVFVDDDTNDCAGYLLSSGRITRFNKIPATPGDTTVLTTDNVKINEYDVNVYNQGIKDIVSIYFELEDLNFQELPAIAVQFSSHRITGP